MNKMKILYDVVKAFRNKEVISGVFTADVQKDERSVFTMTSQFAKNMLTGQRKAKINTQLDYDGKAVHPDGDAEFALHGGRGFHHGMGHRHHFGALAAMHHHGGRGCTMREKFGRLTFMLGVLNALEVTAEKNNTIVLTLNSANLPDEAKEIVRERLSHGGGRHPGHGFMNEFSGLTELEFTFSVVVDESCNIKKAAGTMSGIRQDEQQGHTLKGSAEVVFCDKEQEKQCC